MLIALMARDKAGALETRKANRDAHLAYIDGDRRCRTGRAASG